MRAWGLTRAFGPRVAVDRLDLEVLRGQVFGFLGPNGAGKSTLMRMIVGAMSPSAGRAEVLGLELPRQAEQLREHVGYMPQAFSLYADLSVEENLSFAAEIFSLGGRDRQERRRRVEEALSTHGLEERRGERAGDLSGGWKQRLALAVATIHRPRLLVLDEPTAGIDPEQRRLLWDRLFGLAARGVTLLVSTHSMDEARRCHRLCMMRRGRVVAVGSPPALCARLGGRAFDIRGSLTGETVQALRGRPEVASATQLGEAVHVLLAAGQPAAPRAAALLASCLAAAGLAGTMTIVPAPPTLEDVFVAASLGERLDEPGAAASASARAAPEWRP
ncbi:MAG TPA: ABC transporter ATP-binding protein [Thermoanaerobaculia bacterium]|nr:ABC transporter ATP-binding protein [Thermoanaerobaculia bacterium]